MSTETMRFIYAADRDIGARALRYLLARADRPLGLPLADPTRATHADDPRALS